ncbi:NPCBM/NEW2 domain protein [Allorhodopirellula heiligendammensis]|uniref:NPCBM/NEW2 domain protein n=2 Tax=Allorhodopirellula heiligendammensis TaxID=2714739 RepID=A0A5C6BFY0_9BACT|nr:NPCBM/NEW2 domain protein [Allorhodopirellula heiligendammensis]
MNDQVKRLQATLHPRSRRSLTLTALMLLLCPAADAIPQQIMTTAEQAELANKRLEKYHENQPLPSQRRLRFAYFLPSDREPAAHYRERLTRVLDSMTEFYAEQIASYGLTAQPVALDRDEDGLLRFTEVRGERPWQAYNTKEPASGAMIYSECLPALRAAGIEPTQETIAVFTAVMDWDSERMRFRQRSPYQVNGDAFTQTGMKFSVSSEGEVNTESLRERLVLAPVLANLRIGAAGEAARLTAAIPDEEPAKALALPMLTPPSQRPLAPDADARSWSLCDLRPASATVGWRTPAFDYSPEDLWIEVTGTVRRRGIFAHASSAYTWNLGGDWKSLTATCAVSDGPPGSVVFVVRVNGQETWRSPVTRPGQLVPCKLNISGANKLELIVEDAGDGTHRDHGYWLDPMIAK